MSLQKKAILTVSVILFITLGINTFVLTSIASSRYKKVIFAKTSYIGESLKKELAKVLSLGIRLESLDVANDKLQELMAREPEIGYAMIVDVTGKVLFHSDQSMRGRKLDDRITRNASASRRPLIQSAKSFYDLSFPLFSSEDKMIGALRIGLKSQAVNSQVYTLLLLSLVISFLSFIGSVVLVHFSISRFITRPVLDMEKAAELVASGDLTSAIEVAGEDEIASLGAAINRTTKNLKDMLSQLGSIAGSVSNVTSGIVSSSSDVLKIADIQKKAVEETAVSTDALGNSIKGVAMSAASLSESAEDTSAAIMQMSKSVESVAESARIFDESAQETASSIEEMAASIKQIAASLGNLSASAEVIASSIHEVNFTVIEIDQRASESVGLAEKVMVSASDRGLTSINAALVGMEKIRKSVSSLAGAINVLGKRSEDIGKILNVINEVTDQTNLLSLNAAILAAQAGEHGKSFAVVADHIKSLAERTTASTKEIASLISAVQDETDSSVKMTGEGLHSVKEGLVLVKEVNDALVGILDSSRAATEMSKAIQRATSEQSVVIKQIAASTKEMTAQVENISLAIQEQSKGNNFIVEIAEKMKVLSHQVKSATAEQRDGSVQIAKSIENISNQAEQIARNTGSQKEKSHEIARAMEKIRSTTENLISSSHSMSGSINSLKDEFQNLLMELRKFRV